MLSAGAVRARAPSGTAVEISFKTAKLQKVCNSAALLQKTYGRENAVRIRRRLAVLEAASCLSDVPVLPPERCHALLGSRAGCFAVDVLQPYRIIFEPFGLASGRARINRKSVLAITILDIIDYH